MSKAKPKPAPVTGTLDGCEILPDTPGFARLVIECPVEQAQELVRTQFGKAVCVTAVLDVHGAGRAL